MAARDPRFHSAVEQRHVVEPRVVEREDDPRRRRHPVLAVVDDDAGALGDAQGLEAAAEGVRRRHLERRPTGGVIVEIVHLDEPRAGDVSGVVLGFLPDVQQDEVRVVQMFDEPRRGDEQAVAERGRR